MGDQGMLRICWQRSCGAWHCALRRGAAGGRAGMQPYPPRKASPSVMAGGADTLVWERRSSDPPAPPLPSAVPRGTKAKRSPFCCSMATTEPAGSAPVLPTAPAPPGRGPAPLISTARTRPRRGSGPAPGPSPHAKTRRSHQPPRGGTCTSRPGLAGSPPGAPGWFLGWRSREPCQRLPMGCWEQEQHKKRKITNFNKET